MDASQNHSAENTKSLPCVELSSLLSDKSDHTMSSDSCRTDGAAAPVTDSAETENPTAESRPSVKALVSKYRSFQDKLINAKLTDFNVKKKSFATACENLNTSYNDCCMNMEGDMKRIDKVENFVRQI